MDDTRAWEATVLARVRDVLDGWGDSVRRAGLEVRDVRLSRSSEGPYTSEVQIDFWDECTLFDVLELFVYFRGGQVGPLAEMEAWLDDNLRDIIERAGKQDNQG